jgi:hypothetical protein
MVDYLRREVVNVTGFPKKYKDFFQKNIAAQ